MKVAIILSRVPYPLTKGDKLRAYYQIIEIAKKHQVYLYCLSDHLVDDETIAMLSKYCVNISIYKLNAIKKYFNLLRALFSKQPFQVHYFYQKAIAKRIKTEVELINADVIYAQMIRTAKYVALINHPNKILDFMDALSLGMKRRIDINDGIKKYFIRKEFNRLQNFETKSFSNFNKHIIITREDKNSIQHPKKDLIKVVKNGVDIIYFQPNFAIEKKYDLVFVGNMNYPPNVQCCIFIAKKIIPILQSRGVKVKVLLAGIDPSAEVKELATENIKVSGFMKDIRNAYNTAKIFIAPLEIGSGLQNKVLEAMSMQMPCIISNLAFKAFVNIENNTLLSCDTAIEYADSIEKLLSNKNLTDQLGKNNRKFVINNFSWQNATQKLIDLF